MHCTITFEKKQKHYFSTYLFPPTETGPPEECQNRTWKSTLVLTFAAITLTLLFLVGALIVRFQQVGAIVII